MLQTTTDRMTHAYKVDELEKAHYRDLLSIRHNPRFDVQPSRRDMFKRLGLIKATEPRRAPGQKRRTPAPRKHELTDTGNAVLDQWLQEGGK